MKFLGNVAEVWQESSHIVVITDLPDTEADFSNGDLLELQRPNGTSLQSKGNLILFDPPADRPFAVVFTQLSKEDVPTGTKLWLVNSERPERQKSSLSRKFERISK
jgi:hypothetical protein